MKYYSSEKLKMHFFEKNFSHLQSTLQAVLLHKYEEPKAFIYLIISIIFFYENTIRNDEFFFLVNSVTDKKSVGSNNLIKYMNFAYYL